MGGWGKALWTIFVIVLPYLGVFVYLIARGHKMSEHALHQAQRQEEQMRTYVQSVAGSSTSAADEIGRLAELRDKGALSEEEFQAAKAKVLA
jgi:multidrug resistance efflux pump